MSEQHEYKILPADPIKLTCDIDISALQDSDGIIWENVEEVLFRFASQYVRAFGEIHHDKTFYGFGFDCNADYGDIFVCANTPEALRASAVAYQERTHDLFGREIESHAREALEVCVERLRWSFGDWEFQAFTTEGFSKAWEPIKELLADSIPWSSTDDREIDEYRKSFMEMACRSMVRLETAGALNALIRTDDFKTYVADHDEPDEWSWARLKAVRESCSRCN